MFSSIWAHYQPTQPQSNILLRRIVFGAEQQPPESYEERCLPPKTPLLSTAINHSYRLNSQLSGAYKFLIVTSVNFDHGHVRWTSLRLLMCRGVPTVPPLPQLPETKGSKQSPTTARYYNTFACSIVYYLLAKTLLQLRKWRRNHSYCVFQVQP